ncbi:MAG: glycosyltransferase family 2 protein [Gammaproteobacteria bacterium]
MKIAVAIPCFKVTSKILSVLQNIGPEVDRIYVVDDGCPEFSGTFVQRHCNDKRVLILKNGVNMGVGGAVIAGYRMALEEGMDIVVKIDGDGQMDPSLIPKFVKPIAAGKADYTKGSRFYSLEALHVMPPLRKFGNAMLSVVNKASSGYWNIMDPTNGFTAIHSRALSLLPLEKISNGYFFESDMLFRLGTIRAVIKDIPMDCKYGDEISNLNLLDVAVSFPPLYAKAFIKRVFYNYVLRDFNGATLELILALPLLGFGFFWGVLQWIISAMESHAAATGTIMLSVLPIILGFQLLLSAIHFDMTNIPETPLQEMD